MDTWKYAIWFGSVFSPVLPLMWVWKRLNDYQWRIVAFISISFFTDLLATYIIRGNNYVFHKVYGLAESIILLYFYRQVLDNDKKKFEHYIIVFGIFYITDAVFFENVGFNGIGRSVECLVMIALSLVLFYQFFVQEDDIYIERNPLFWFNVAILTYFSGSFFSFVLSEEIFSRDIEPWILHNLSNIFKNVLLAIGLWKIPRR